MLRLKYFLTSTYLFILISSHSDELSLREEARKHFDLVFIVCSSVLEDVDDWIVFVERLEEDGVLTRRVLVVRELELAEGDGLFLPVLPKVGRVRMLIDHRVDTGLGVGAGLSLPFSVEESILERISDAKFDLNRVESLVFEATDSRPDERKCSPAN